MRWENLFDDLESQLEVELGSDEIDMQAEEERLRLGRLTIRDRLKELAASSPNAPRFCRLELADGVRVRVCLEAIGKDWLSGEVQIESGSSRTWLIPLEGIATVVVDRALEVTTKDQFKEPVRELSDRLGFGFALRDLSRRRVDLDLVTRLGNSHGTIDRVGRDHIDFAVHEKGTPRRENSVSEFRLVPFTQILAVKL
ncbi:MAG: hypothetical protein IT191_00695 [Microbacteriaceae bacterium]|nr:hypothetical protein [Microbacteriaceae bacterium]